MQKTNKQVIEELTEYFLKSDPKEVARSLANFMLDIHRLTIIDALPEKERLNLCERIELNNKEFVRFAKEGPRKGEKLRVMSMNSE